MKFHEIVAWAKENMEKADVSAFGGHLAVEFCIIGDGEAAGIYYVELKDGKLYVEPYEYHDRDCRMIASSEVFINILEGKLDSVAAFLTGKLKIEGSVDKALEFQKILKSIDIK